MFSIFEERRRYPELVGPLYRVMSIYLFGFVLVWRGWYQLTATLNTALPGERK